MYLDVLSDDGSCSRYPISREQMTTPGSRKTVKLIHSQHKVDNALEIYHTYFEQSKVILFDASNQRLFEKIQILQKESLLESMPYLMMFFTSGSTGDPVGALKSRENLESEVRALAKLLAVHSIKRLVVTVPFVHIYGALLGLLYPLICDIDILFKEHFLPHDLLEVIDEETLVVTTPLYIKALTKLHSSKLLARAVFVSSTAPLDTPSVAAFIDKYDTTLIQLFGSTETGGIAYKRDLESLRTPLDGVNLACNAKNELIVTSPFVSELLYERGFSHTGGSIETFDYVEMQGKQFRLLGRSSKILKIAGKRYSTVQIESLLEEIDGIAKALVFVESDPSSLRGELLNITLESNRNFTVQEIKKQIQRSFSNLKFSIKLNIVETIPTSALGKKLLI